MKISKLFCVYSSLLGAFFTSVAVPPSHADMIRVYEAAIGESPLVRQLHEKGLERRKAQKRDIEALREAIKGEYQRQAMSLDDLCSSVTSRLQRDKTFVEERLNPVISALQQERTQKEQPPLSVPLQTHKLLFGINGAIQLAPNLGGILEGKMPAGYSLEVPCYNTLGGEGEDHIYTSVRARVLETLLTTALHVLRGGKMGDVIRSVIPDFEKRSPLYYVMAMPEDLLQRLKGEDLAAFSWIDGDQLIEPYGGYIFGGGHWGDGATDDRDAAFRALDCSSIISTALNLPGDAPDTVDWWLYHMEIRDGDLDQFPYTFLNGDVLATWRKTLLPLWQKNEHRSSFDNIVLVSSQPRSGQIHLERGMKSLEEVRKNPELLKGAGGHIGIYLGQITTGEGTFALTLGSNRDIDGERQRDFAYGVELRPFKSVEPTEKAGGRYVVYFDVKGS